jgi:SagB-type dehydrogenase family enzyme
MPRDPLSLLKLAGSNDVEMPDVEDVYVFHESTKNSPSVSVGRSLRIANYLTLGRAIEEQCRNYKTYVGHDRIELPPPNKIATSLGDTLEKRISTRAFSGVPMNTQELSDLLACLRVNRRQRPQGHSHLELGMRSYPSGGGLFAIETYLFALNVENVPKTVLHYDARRHGLNVVCAFPDSAPLQKAVGDGGDFARNASLFVVFTMVPKRLLVKYDKLGYRFCLLEAGIVSQHLTLTATALNLATLHWGSSYDDMLNDLLHVDGVEETVAHHMWVGKAR